MSGLNEPASFSLSFLGSQVSVYGGVQHEEENLSVSPSISSAYSIDNVVIDTYNIVMPTGSDEFGVLFFTSGDLGASDHQLSFSAFLTLDKSFQSSTLLTLDQYSQSSTFLDRFGPYTFTFYRFEEHLQCSGALLYEIPHTFKFCNT
ncbi:hypothetical protein EW026_g6286 [Hermanssonia centrifuga]|uniref:Uncharacterized protein n=1 Tax=Hermanssonia centrifuga TaxID=98765 RepID=A0A4S4KBH1_9APHY|nr:hypothetical protein EW026_g6286 [Hermanssonia centrifuga]